ncbi:MAG: bifunctional oligoribonuclease/PAP phosphatase NrnA, partial [Candidatus Omnitrophica bacterium]|nr:bifunctional oligoribonuclease/PAP phosphatase NrnA [Candidatus Omnitrophota bacterium]
ARSFGGGGHMAASGCTVEGTLAQARAKVLRTVRQALRSSLSRG